jgi:hypothetical protein
MVPTAATLLAGAFLFVPTLLSGCAFHQRELVLDPVGPPPSAASATASQGSLLVFSAFDPTPDLNRSPYRRQYTDYKILSADGKQLVARVCNDNGLLLEGPRKVDLPAGTYRVLARANGYGTATVPVVIRSGQTTTLHLEGSVWWPKSTGIFQANPVRLPGGEIAGWRATGDPAHPLHPGSQ